MKDGCVINLPPEIDPETVIAMECLSGCFDDDGNQVTEITPCVGQVIVETISLEASGLSEKEYEVQKALGTLPMCVEVVRLSETPFNDFARHELNRVVMLPYVGNSRYTLKS